MVVLKPYVSHFSSRPYHCPKSYETENRRFLLPIAVPRRSLRTSPSLLFLLHGSNGSQTRFSSHHSHHLYVSFVHFPLSRARERSSRTRFSLFAVGEYLCRLIYHTAFSVDPNVAARCVSLLYLLSRFKKKLKKTDPSFARTQWSPNHRHQDCCDPSFVPRLGFTSLEC